MRLVKVVVQDCRLESALSPTRAPAAGAAFAENAGRGDRLSVAFSGRNMSRAMSAVVYPTFGDSAVVRN